MTVQAILEELEEKGNPNIKKILLKHGVKEPFFGAKIEDMKVIQKRVKKDYQLSKDLYATGNSDAMYLAGLIADESKMTKKDLATWVKQAESPNICDYTVPWIAAESQHGFELALEWIESKESYIAAAGWSTLCSVVAIKADDELDMSLLKTLLARVEKEIHKADNHVRSRMNMFVISVGSYVASLTDKAIAIAQKIGTVKVDVGDTSCKVPGAVDYINKVKNKGAIGKKKKMARC
ncbi:MAG: alkylation repair protein [Bacteroidetes bacterium]|jgi:3-methyladenine DNA glycosylase AlkD|nr:alkylation repair protein [Bacteroidota bacterium]MDF2452933.1 alkylation repair protein [Bacteroidota bacterium]